MELHPMVAVLKQHPLINEIPQGYEINPNYVAQGHDTLLDMLEKSLGAAEQALEHCRECKTCLRMYSWFHKCLAIIYYDSVLKDPRRALDVCATALDANEQVYERIDIMNIMAYCLRDVGRPRDGLKRINEAIEMAQSLLPEKEFEECIANLVDTLEDLSRAVADCVPVENK